MFQGCIILCARNKDFNCTYMGTHGSENTIPLTIPKNNHIIYQVSITFSRQFTSLFSQHALSYREKDLQTDYLNVINQHFGNQENLQQTIDSAYPPRPPLRPGGSEYERPPKPGYGPVDGAYVPGLRPGRPSRPGRPFPPGFLPVRPALPPGFRPPSASHPQTSLFEALYSIAKYDDLRCVPRLLCEVTSGSNVTKSNKKDDKSPVPFLTKDAFIT